MPSTLIALLSAVLLAGPALGCSDANSRVKDKPGRVDAGPSAGHNAVVAPSDEISLTEVQVGDFSFRARVAGSESGEVVILLHGFPEDSYEWRTALRALARQGYRAFAPDQRGYSSGARPSAVSDYAVPKLVADVIGMADAIGASKFHIVGHDWGAVVVWNVAARAPERLLSVTTLSVPHSDAFSQELADKTSCQYNASSYFDFFIMPAATDYFVANDFSSLRGIYAGVPSEDVDVYIQELGSRDTIDAALNWYRANITNRQGMGPALGKISVPTLFIWSDGDTSLCGEGGELSRGFVDAPYRFETIAGANHWLVDNAPEPVNALLLEHIGKYSAKR